MKEENTKVPLVYVEDGMTPEILACIRRGASPLTEGYEQEIPPQMPPAYEKGKAPPSSN